MNGTIHTPAANVRGTKKRQLFFLFFSFCSCAVFLRFVSSISSSLCRLEIAITTCLHLPATSPVADQSSHQLHPPSIVQPMRLWRRPLSFNLPLLYKTARTSPFQSLALNLTQPHVSYPRRSLPLHIFRKHISGIKKKC